MLQLIIIFKRYFSGKNNKKNAQKFDKFNKTTFADRKGAGNKSANPVTGDRSTHEVSTSKPLNKTIVSSDKNVSVGPSFSQGDAGISSRANKDLKDEGANFSKIYTYALKGSKSASVKNADFDNNSYRPTDQLKATGLTSRNAESPVDLNPIKKPGLRSHPIGDYTREQLRNLPRAPAPWAPTHQAAYPYTSGRRSRRYYKGKAGRPNNSPTPKTGHEHKSFSEDTIYAPDWVKAEGTDDDEFRNGGPFRLKSIDSLDFYDNFYITMDTRIFKNDGETIVPLDPAATIILLAWRHNTIPSGIAIIIISEIWAHLDGRAENPSCFFNLFLMISVIAKGLYAKLKGGPASKLAKFLPNLTLAELVIFMRAPAPTGFLRLERNLPKPLLTTEEAFDLTSFILPGSTRLDNPERCRRNETHARRDRRRRLALVKDYNELLDKTDVESPNYSDDPNLPKIPADEKVWIDGSVDDPIYGPRYGPTGGPTGGPKGGPKGGPTWGSPRGFSSTASRRSSARGSHAAEPAPLKLPLPEIKKNPLTSNWWKDFKDQSNLIKSLWIKHFFKENPHLVETKEERRAVISAKKLKARWKYLLKTGRISSYSGITELSFDLAELLYKMAVKRWFLYRRGEDNAREARLSEAWMISTYKDLWRAEFKKRIDKIWVAQKSGRRLPGGLRLSQLEKVSLRTLWRITKAIAGGGENKKKLLKNIAATEDTIWMADALFNKKPDLTKADDLNAPFYIEETSYFLRLQKRNEFVTSDSQFRQFLKGRLEYLTSDRIRKHYSKILSRLKKRRALGKAPILKYKVKSIPLEKYKPGIPVGALDLSNAKLTKDYGILFINIKHKIKSFRSIIFFKNYNLKFFDTYPGLFPAWLWFRRAMSRRNRPYYKHRPICDALRMPYDRFDPVLKKFASSRYKGGASYSSTATFDSIANIERRKTANMIMTNDSLLSFFKSIAVNLGVNFLKNSSVIKNRWVLRRVAELNRHVFNVSFTQLFGRLKKMRNRKSRRSAAVSKINPRFTRRSTVFRIIGTAYPAHVLRKVSKIFPVFSFSYFSQFLKLKGPRGRSRYAHFKNSAAFVYKYLGLDVPKSLSSFSKARRFSNLNLCMFLITHFIRAAFNIKKSPVLSSGHLLWIERRSWTSINGILSPHNRNALKLAKVPYPFPTKKFNMIFSKQLFWNAWNYHEGFPKSTTPVNYLRHRSYYNIIQAFKKALLSAVLTAESFFYKSSRTSRKHRLPFILARNAGQAFDELGRKFGGLYPWSINYRKMRRLKKLINVWDRPSFSMKFKSFSRFIDYSSKRAVFSHVINNVKARFSHLKVFGKLANTQFLKYLRRFDTGAFVGSAAAKSPHPDLTFYNASNRNRRISRSRGLGGFFPNFANLVVKENSFYAREHIIASGALGWFRQTGLPERAHIKKDAAITVFDQKRTQSPYGTEFNKYWNLNFYKFAEFSQPKNNYRMFAGGHALMTNFLANYESAVATNFSNFYSCNKSAALKLVSSFFSSATVSGSRPRTHAVERGFLASFRAYQSRFKLLKRRGHWYHHNVENGLYNFSSFIDNPDDKKSGVYGASAGRFTELLAKPVLDEFKLFRYVPDFFTFVAIFRWLGRFKKNENSNFRGLPHFLFFSKAVLKIMSVKFMAEARKVAKGVGFASKDLSVFLKVLSAAAIKNWKSSSRAKKVVIYDELIKLLTALKLNPKADFGKFLQAIGRNRGFAARPHVSVDNLYRRSRAPRVSRSEMKTYMLDRLGIRIKKKAPAPAAPTTFVPSKVFSLSDDQSSQLNQHWYSMLCRVRGTAKQRKVFYKDIGPYLKYRENFVKQMTNRINAYSLKKFKEGQKDLKRFARSKSRSRRRNAEEALPRLRTFKSNIHSFSATFSERGIIAACFSAKRYKFYLSKFWLFLKSNLYRSLSARRRVNQSVSAFVDDFLVAGTALTKVEWRNNLYPTKFLKLFESGKLEASGLNYSLPYEVLYSKDLFAARRAIDRSWDLPMTISKMHKNINRSFHPVCSPQRISNYVKRILLSNSRPSKKFVGKNAFGLLKRLISAGFNNDFMRRRGQKYYAYLKALKTSADREDFLSFGLKEVDKSLIKKLAKAHKFSKNSFLKKKISKSAAYLFTRFSIADRLATIFSELKNYPILRDKYIDNFKTSFANLVHFNKTRNLAKRNVQTKGRSTFIYYTQKRPWLQRKWNRPFKLISSVMTPGVFIYPNKLGSMGSIYALRRIFNARMRARAKHMRLKVFTKYILRKKFRCTMSALRTRWRLAKQTKRKWFKYFDEFEARLANIVCLLGFYKYIEDAELAVKWGLVSIDGAVCFNPDFKVKPMSIVSLDAQAYMHFRSDKVAQIMREHLSYIEAPNEIKRQILGFAAEYVRENAAVARLKKGGFSVTKFLFFKRLLNHVVRKVGAPAQSSHVGPGPINKKAFVKKFTPRRNAYYKGSERVNIHSAIQDSENFTMADLGAGTQYERFSVDPAYGRASKLFTPSRITRMLSRAVREDSTGLTSALDANSSIFFRYDNVAVFLRRPHTIYEMFDETAREPTSTYNPEVIEEFYLSRFEK